MYFENIVDPKNLPDTALLPNGKIPLFCYDSKKLYPILETFEDIKYYGFVDINKNFDFKKISEKIPEKKDLPEGAYIEFNEKTSQLSLSSYLMASSSLPERYLTIDKTWIKLSSENPYLIFKFIKEAIEKHKIKDLEGTFKIPKKYFNINSPFEEKRKKTEQEIYFSSKNKLNKPYKAKNKINHAQI